MSIQKHRHILLSIRPNHAEQIYSGDKKLEIRKSFPEGFSGLVFLYETLPVGAVTGAFYTATSTKLPVHEIASVSGGHGVSAERVHAYFEHRRFGWAIDILFAMRFKRPVPLDELQQRNHYFRPPLSYCFMSEYDAVYQRIRDEIVCTSVDALELRNATKSDVAEFAGLIRDCTALQYQDIDTDFERQALEEGVGLDSAFSTTAKDVLSMRVGGIGIGYTVLSHKAFGAIKSGPTIMRPEFRGLGIGLALRQRVVEYGTNRRCRKVYCTCPAPLVGLVGHFLNAGYQIEAVLKKHLHSGRDEVVLGRLLRTEASASRIRATLRTAPKQVKWRANEVTHDPVKRDKALKVFYDFSEQWYFKLSKKIQRAIQVSLGRVSAAKPVYSEKPRLLVSVTAANGSIAGVLLVTFKRSGMAKLNWVAKYDDDALVGTAAAFLKSWAPTKEVRRFYLTLPVHRMKTVATFVECGFGFEGVLRQPFQAGVDHACLGLLR